MTRRLHSLLLLLLLSIPGSALLPGCSDGSAETPSATAAAGDATAADGGEASDQAAPPTTVTFQGQVKDMFAMEPVTDYQIQITRSFSGGVERRQERIQNEDGSFDIPDNKPGKVGWIVEADGYATKLFTMKEIGPGVQQIGDVGLRPARKLNVKVVYADNKTPAVVQIEPLDEFENYVPWDTSDWTMCLDPAQRSRWRKALTNADGLYEFQALPAGLIVLIATDPQSGQEAPFPIDLMEPVEELQVLALPWHKPE